MFLTIYWSGGIKKPHRTYLFILKAKNFSWRYRWFSLNMIVVLSGTPIHIIITSDCGNFIQTEYDLPAPLFIRYNGELMAYNLILLMNPNDLSAGIEKGRILYQLGRLDEAHQAFDAVIRIDRKNADAWYEKALVYSYMSCYEEVIQACDRSLQVNPEKAEAWFLRGLYLSVLDRCDEAILAYDNVLQIKPDSAGAWHNKGLIYERMGHYDKAITAYDSALRIHPDDKLVQENREKALNALKKK